jgi:hypothetical protein
MGEIIPFVTTRDLRSLIVCKSELLSQARTDPRISHAEYRIYSAALDYVHRDLDDRLGMLWPSVSRLARDACCKTRRTVQTAMTKFVALEYLHLVSDRRGGRTGHGSSATAVCALPGVLNSAIDAPVNSAIDAPVNSAIDAPQSFREEPMEETSLRDVSLRRQRARPTLRHRGDLKSWAPREQDGATARERGYGETWIADQVERFRDHHLSKGTALRDIDAAWRNWQRIAFDRDEEPPDPPSSASASTTHAVVREHLGEAGLMLLSRIGETAFCHWFGPPVRWNGVSDSALNLTVPSRFMRSKLLEQFEQTLCSCFGVKHVEITVDASQKGGDVVNG